MHILPCLWCGSEAHEGGHTMCPHYGYKARPKSWNQQIESLGNFPVKGPLGRILRLRMLNNWSTLPSPVKISKVPMDPKEFDKIDVDGMPEGVVYSWCAIFDIVARDAKKARQALKIKFGHYARGTIDVHSTMVDISHPYRCSMFPMSRDSGDPNDDRLSLMHTANLPVDPNNVFAMFGQSCPEPGCTGVIDPDILG